MNLEISALALPFLAGSLLGGVYFGGLWMTLRRLPRTGRPLLLLGASTLGRLALLVGAAYVVMDGRWERLLACLAGILVARAFVLRRYGRAPRPSTT